MSIRQLITNTATGEKSLSRVTQFVGFLVSTGIVIWYTYHFRLDEWMFTSYFLICVGAYSANKYIAQKGGSVAGETKNCGHANDCGCSGMESGELERGAGRKVCANCGMQQPD
ncbi:hypothetical protein [Yersinia phage PY100]|nr:hypothetical protein [Yersinia phage PY100]